MSFLKRITEKWGILINKSNDNRIFQDAVEESRSIKSSSIKEANNNYFNGFNTYHNNGQSQQGYCLRCQTKIEFDPDRPFCKSCYHEWNLWANKSYQENFCHGCSQPFNTSFAYPLCDKCYNANSM
jgi:hypothetical protein